MIRFDRGNRPKRVVLPWAKRLKKAIQLYNAGTRPSGPRVLTGYALGSAKAALWSAQHGKCAWCEQGIRRSGSHVEHYRPRDGAWRHVRGRTKQSDDDCYWWLTWTWENLVLSCGTCTNPTYKANYFPLEAGSGALARPSRPVAVPPPSSFFDTSAEKPLLLDPGSDDPLDHVVWAPLDRALPRAGWMWTPRGMTPRGWRTIDVLGLVDVAERVGTHLRANVLGRVEDVEAHANAGRSKKARRVWQRILDDQLHPDAEYRAATWCALELWIPAAERSKHGLPDPPRP